MGSPLAPPPFTCRHEEDAGTKDDVMSGFVELAGCDAEATDEKQNHTQDRENTRGPYSPWSRERWGRKGRKNSRQMRQGGRGQGRPTDGRQVGKGED